MARKNGAGGADVLLQQVVTHYDENGDIITPGVVKIDQVYGAEDAPALKGWEAIRRRPGMYIGDVGIRGLHHLFKEIIDNSVDEVLTGNCTAIDVVLGDDYSITVSDNGRGIPVDIIGDSGKTGVELVFTDIHAGGKLHGDGYKVFGGLHGIGASAVNALSEWLQCDVKRSGKVHRMRFERGVPMTSLETVGDCDTEGRGTTVTWLADKTMFHPALTNAGNLAYDGGLIANRYRELAYLLPAARITFHDRLYEKPPQTFHFPNGVADYVRDLNWGRDVFPAEPIAIRGTVGETHIEVALQYSDADGSAILGFGNMLPTPDDGTHVTGFRRALTTAVNGISAVRTKHDGKTTRRGLTAVISVTVHNPYWYGSSKTRLANHELAGIVFSLVYARLKNHWAQYPEQGQGVLKRLMRYTD
ncbi:MAG: hypothetical protein H7145_13515 [Akkermansiaceae bacterium]|nr:hypothetical protein [Armatimonadota bacterium]